LLVGEVDELVAFHKLATGLISQLPGATDASQWFLIAEGSAAAGQTLAQLESESQLGAAVRAILRKGKCLRFPDSQTVIQAGDKVLVFGEPTFLAELGRKIAVTTDLNSIAT
jgi:monovalent cation:H+ antiporter-2, CPA2 family